MDRTKLNVNCWAESYSWNSDLGWNLL